MKTETMLQLTNHYLSRGLQMKKVAVAFATLTAAQLCFSANSAGLAGIINTSGTTDVNSFQKPKDIWTVYFANDPSESAVVLAYVAYRKLGQHQLSIEWSGQNGKVIDKCEFDLTSVTKLPHIHTITCKWGGNLPDGGLTFSVHNRLEGKKEKIGEMFLPSKLKQ